MQVESLIEYCFGNSSTEWGRRRIVEDEHPAVYPLRSIELGNEQGNPNFVAQVEAMEAKMEAVGRGRNQITYLYPSNSVGSELSDAQLVAASASRVGLDLHTRMTGGVQSLLAELDGPRAAAYEGWGGMVLETNCGPHDMGRALFEAQALLELFGNQTLGRKLYGRAASFCMGAIRVTMEMNLAAHTPRRCCVALETI